MTATLEPTTGNASDALGPAPAHGLRAAVARQVVARILQRVPVTARLADGDVYGAPVTAGLPLLQIDQPRAFFSRLARSPMIGLGESYMAGEWSTGHGTDLADALSPFAERLTRLIKPSFYKLRHTVLPRGLNPENTKDGARKNIEAHYDLSNEMFASFLDPSLSYSSALFDTLDPAPTAADLEQAQLNKVDAILEEAGVTHGSRVLEIGTGWGTLAIRAAERGAHVTTLTISREQAALAQQRVDDAGVGDRVEIALRDYRDQSGEFDAIVSVEMIEAVGEKYWPTYFSTIESLLAPGGKVAIQAILMSHDRMLATRDTYTWIHKYIFPGGLLPSLEAIDHTLEHHTSMKVTHVRQMGPHYAHTLRLWRAQFLDRWQEVADLGFDEKFRRMWEFYLAYCEAGFRTGYIDVAQIRMERVSDAA